MWIIYESTANKGFYDKIEVSIFFLSLYSFFYILSIIYSILYKNPIHKQKTKVLFLKYKKFANENPSAYTQTTTHKKCLNAPFRKRGQPTASP